MIALQTLSSEPWVERLGWTLVHFLWQGLAIAVLYASMRWIVGSKSNPQMRYLLACAALIAMIAAPLVTYGLMLPWDVGPDAGSQVRSALQIGSSITNTVTLPGSVRSTVSSVRSPQFLSWVVMIWVAGAAAFSVRLTGGWIVAARMRSASIRPAPPEWQEFLTQLGRVLGLKGPVRLLISALVQVPTVVGWLRPIILIPVGALSGLPREHLEALLLHELAHIRRHDYLVNILQSVVEALLFYHPAVWWVSAHIRAERELCCDDVAVSVVGDRLMYARALAQLESYRPAHFESAIAANGGSLSHRIARLVGPARPADRLSLGPGILVLALLLVFAAYGLLAQPSAHPSFETVSIKRNTTPWSERFQHPIGLHSNASLLLLIQFAYASHENPMSGHVLPLPTSQIAGGPAWINSEGYDIEAKAKANAMPGEQWQMWQTLLADRFKLKLHRETRELPVYVLTAAQGGLKLPAPPKDIECVSFPPGTQPRHIPGKVDCGYVSGPFGDSDRLRIEGSRVHVGDLTKELAVILDRPVFDRTGFAGDFDLNLSFAPDEALRGIPAGVFRLPDNPNLPNIFAALEAQLGLKLSPAKGSVEVLVIDSAERPVENQADGGTSASTHAGPF